MGFDDIYSQQNRDRRVTTTLHLTREDIKYLDSIARHHHTSRSAAARSVIAEAREIHEEALVLQYEKEEEQQICTYIAGFEALQNGSDDV